MKNLLTIKKIAVAAAVMLPAMAIASGAHASSVSQPFFAEIGAGFLTSNHSSDVTSSTGLHAGLGYTLPGTGVTSGTPSIDFDYDYINGHGNTADVYGLFVADRYSFTKVATAGTFTPYIGAGIGATLIDGSGHGSSNNQTNFAGKVMIGARVNQAFVELGYSINGNLHSYNADDLNLSIGTHF